MYFKELNTKAIRGALNVKVICDSHLSEFKIN